MKKISTLLLTLVLTACGGGGGSSSSSSPMSSVLSLTNTNTVYTETVTDVNGDGLDDVVVSGWNRDSSTAYVYLLEQNSDGTMSNKTSLLGSNIIGGSQRVLVSDFDNDGHVDIFIPGFSDGSSMHTENSVMYWGNGTGFTRQDWSDQSMAHGACIGDLNNDGLPDLLIAGTGIWINNGGRSFTLHSSVLSNNYFTACAVIKETGNNTIYLSQNGTVAGFNDSILVLDYSLNIVSSVGYQSDINFNTINVTVADLTGDGHKDFVISMNGSAVNAVGPREIIAYTAPNTYSYNTTLESARSLYYDHAITINGIDSVLFSGDSQNASLYQGTTKLYPTAFTTMAPNNPYNPANVYQDNSGHLYMLQLINNTFYTEKLQ